MRCQLSAVVVSFVVGCGGNVYVEGGPLEEGGSAPIEFPTPPDPDPEPTGDGANMRVVPRYGDDYPFSAQLVQTEGVDGTYDGWCTNLQASSPSASYQAVELFWSDELIPDTLVLRPDNLDLLNYLLSTYEIGDPAPSGSSAFITGSDLQNAVWRLLDDSGDGYEVATLLVEDAKAHGEGFRPGCGDTVVLLAQTLPPDLNVQTLALEIPYAAAECQ